jgi:hypothetical protein
VSFSIEHQEDFLYHLLSFCHVTEKLERLLGYTVDISSKKSLERLVIASLELLNENMVVLVDNLLLHVHIATLHRFWSPPLHPPSPSLQTIVTAGREAL